MAALYCSCDALVQPFRGEGFGLPIVEAMACGLPVVITGAGPALDYASDKTPYLIPAERRPLGGGTVGGMETIGQPWLFEPDGDALVELLKGVASDRNGARAIGMAASDHIREHFTWARTVETVEQRLTVLVPRPERTLTRSVSEGIPTTHVGAEHSQPSDDLTALITDDSDCATNDSEEMPPLADASGWYGDPASTVARGQRVAKVSLTMIVKNEQQYLPRCLASIEGIIDEIIVVDTGSTDRTKEIAREFGATGV